MLKIFFRNSFETPVFVCGIILTQLKRVSLIWTNQYSQCLSARQYRCIGENEGH